MQLQHGTQEGGRPLGIRVGEVEDPDDLFLVLALLLGRIRVDEHRLGVDDLHRQLIGARDQVKGVLNTRLAQVDRDPGVAAQVSVEDEVDAARARHHVEHRAKASVAKIERDRPQLAEHRLRAVQQHLAPGHFQLALQLHQPVVMRIVLQGQRDATRRRIAVAVGDERLRLDQRVTLLAFDRQRGELA